MKTMNALGETLIERVDGLLDAGKSQELRSTTGSHGALIELCGRVEGLEQAVREVAAEVERLRGRQPGSRPAV
jgi:hypothetical protein